jgi:hypothetical protein
LTLASLLWRLRRVTTIETGLFQIQAEHLSNPTNKGHVDPAVQQIVYALFGQTSVKLNEETPRLSVAREPGMTQRRNTTISGLAADPAVDLARCFLRLADLPNFALDRLSRYEAWRQVGQTLFALDVLDRRKPQERGQRVASKNRPELPVPLRDHQ